MKYLIAFFIVFIVASCTTPQREHRMTRMNHTHACNAWIHHDHDDQHGGSYWHTHCDEDHN